jgi:hypothetical protein
MPRWDTASADRDGRTRARQPGAARRPPPPLLPACWLLPGMPAAGAVRPTAHDAGEADDRCDGRASRSRSAFTDHSTSTVQLYHRIEPYIRMPHTSRVGGRIRTFWAFIHFHGHGARLTIELQPLHTAV